MITIENVNTRLKLAGCVGIHDKRGANWHRVFIHMQREGKPPLSLGRVMFHEGEFSHVKWYGFPSRGGIQQGDFQVWNIWCALHYNRTLSNDQWEFIVRDATELAKFHRQAKLDARAKLPKFSASGKLKSRPRIAEANPRRYVGELIGKLFK